MFTVQVADNFHYMDQDEVHTHGAFDTWDDAVAAAQGIVDRCLLEYLKAGMTAAGLYAQYTLFGDDPFIVPVPAGQRFSAREYAERRCAELCG